MRLLKSGGHLGEVEVHPGLARLHVAAGDQRAEVAEHHTAEHVQPGVGTHQPGAALVLHRADDLGAGRRQRVTLGGDQVGVVALAGADDPGLHALPQQHAVVRRLATAARVERRAVQHDALLGIGVQDRARPLAQGRVGKVEPVRPAMLCDAHDRAGYSLRKPAMRSRRSARSVQSTPGRSYTCRVAWGSAAASSLGDLDRVQVVARAADHQRRRGDRREGADLAQRRLVGERGQAVGQTVAEQLVEPLPQVRPAGRGVAHRRGQLQRDDVGDRRGVPALHRLQQVGDAFPGDRAARLGRGPPAGRRPACSKRSGLSASSRQRAPAPRLAPNARLAPAEVGDRPQVPGEVQVVPRPVRGVGAAMPAELEEHLAARSPHCRTGGWWRCRCPARARTR